MNEYAPSLSKLQHEQSLRKPYAGNLHVRFDEEEGAACPPLLTLLFFVVHDRGSTENALDRMMLFNAS